MREVHDRELQHVVRLVKGDAQDGCSRRVHRLSEGWKVDSNNCHISTMGVGKIADILIPWHMVLLLLGMAFFHHAWCNHLFHF